MTVPDLEKEVRRRVKLVQKVIGQNKLQIEDIEEGVRSVLLAQELEASARIGKENKKAAERLAAAISRLSAALNHSDLPNSLNDWLIQRSLRVHNIITELVPADYSAQVSYLEKFGDPFEMLAALQEQAEAIKTSKQSTKREGDAKRAAVREAEFMLLDLNIPRTLSRTEKFCRLAAALYGDKNADMLDICRAHKQT